MARKKAEEKQMETVPSLEILQDIKPEQIENDLGVDEQYREKAANEPPTPSRLDPEWSDWLLTQFHESEVVKKKEGKKENIYPRVHGLRRLAQKYVGDIVESVAAPLQHSNLTTNESGGAGFTPSTCLYTIKFRKHEDGQLVTYSDVGDCFWFSQEWSSQDREFAVYPGPIAATRAEARCLRKALGLAVCSIEELGPKKKVVNNEVKETIVNPDEDVKVKITDGQIDFLNVQCQTARLNIHPLDFLKTINNSINNINQVTYVEAANACKVLGELWRRKNNKEDSVTAYKNEKKVTIRPYTKTWIQE